MQCEWHHVCMCSAYMNPKRFLVPESRDYADAFWCLFLSSKFNIVSSSFIGTTTGQFVCCFPLQKMFLSVFQSTLCSVRWWLPHTLNQGSPGPHGAVCPSFWRASAATMAVLKNWAEIPPAAFLKATESIGKVWQYLILQRHFKRNRWTRNNGLTGLYCHPWCRSINKPSLRSVRTGYFF